VLRAPLDAINEAELLKSKLIVLYQIVDLMIFFQAHPTNCFYDHFSKLFHQSIKHSIIQIALQNPDYVSKYSREFILQLKTVAIT
jgi:hypothetical protein